MEKKTECEIVQDLLINYVDDILNPESKKLVEKHLIECKVCQSRFEDIKKDLKNDETKEKMEIDYLKKIRRKTKLKSILSIIVVLFIILFGYYLYKFTILNSISSKMQRQFETENFYIKKTSNTGFEEGVMCVNEMWYKDGKYKIVSHIENSKEILQKFKTRYGNIEENSKEEYELDEDTKEIKKVELLYKMNKEYFIPTQNPIFIKNNLILKLGAPFHTKISTDNKEIGREYYVLELGEGEQWIDMETGLPIMIWGYSSSIQYYKDTKIPIHKAENISEYKYEFNIVTDEDVELPEFK